MVGKSFVEVPQIFILSLFSPVLFLLFFSPFFSFPLEFRFCFAFKKRNKANVFVISFHYDKEVPQAVPEKKKSKYNKYYYYYIFKNIYSISIPFCLLL